VEVFINQTTAVRADPGRAGAGTLKGTSFCSRFRKFPAAVLAEKEGLTFFYRKKRDEKKVKIVINPHLIKGSPATEGTGSGPVIKFFNFWSYPANEKKQFFLQ
jgi:hypothetical protein